MLNIPENIKELFRRNNSSRETWRHLRLRFYDGKINFLYPDDILFPSDELFPTDDTPMLLIEGDQIPQELLNIEQDLCMSESLRFGECNASMVEVTVTDVRMDLEGKEFTASVETGGYELMLGIYKVDSFERQANRRMKKITAFDRMRNFQVDVAEWYRGLTFPMTLKAFRDSLCDYVGIRQIETVLPLDDMIISKTIEPAQLYGLNVIKAICELNGCFGHMDVTGRFKYVFLGASSTFPSETLFPDEHLFPEQMEGETLSLYRQATYEDYLTYGIEKVVIRQEEGDVGAIYGEGGNTYTIQGNFLVFGKSANELLSIAATTFDQISGKVYRPCEITAPALPWVELGDGLICYTNDDVIETYCLQRRLKGIQAMTDMFVAAGTRERKENFGIGTQIMQLEGKAAVIKRNVEEVSVRVTNLKEYTEAQFKVTAEEIVAEVKRAKEAEAKLSIRADKIEMSVTKEIDRATAAETLLASRIDMTAEQIEMEVKRATAAEGQLSSNIRLTAEQIVAEVKRAQEAESQLKIEAGKISTSVTNLTKNTNSRFEQTDKSIALKVSKGDVSSQLSVESDKITLSGNRLIVDSTNFKLDGKGNATFSGKVEGASIIGGTIDIGGGTFVVDKYGNVQINSGEIDFGNVFYVSDEYLYLGDFKISNDATNVFRASDDSIVFQTADGGPFGDYPTLRLSASDETTLLSSHHLKTKNIDAYTVAVKNAFEWQKDGYNGNVGYILDAIWSGHSWSLENLKEMIEDLKNRVSDLESMV